MLQNLLNDLYLNEAWIIFDIAGFTGEIEAKKIDSGLSTDEKLIFSFNDGNIEINLKDYELSKEEGELGEEVYKLENNIGNIIFQITK